MHALTHTESKLLHFIYENTKYTKRKYVFIHICLCLVCINACTDLHENLCVDQYHPSIGSNHMNRMLNQKPACSTKTPISA